MTRKHDASGQMGGYLYQAMCALLLLLKTKNIDAQIVMEKFDDITFMENETPVDMIQIKHQINKPGNLSNTSVDLWRTINSWIDTINSNSLSIENTRFFILTTAKVPANSITSLLGFENRKVTNALEQMEYVAREDRQKTNSSYYKNFLTLSNDDRKSFLDNIYIISNMCQIDKIKDEIMPYLRMTVIPKYEDKAYESILGWWLIKVVEGLNTQQPSKKITYRSLRKKIIAITSEYKADSLPIDIDVKYQPSIDELEKISGKEKIFIEQLKLITKDEDVIKRCIREYYGAYSQRSLWIRDQVVFAEDLMDYENKLKEEWSRYFQYMKEDLYDGENEVTDKEKVNAGKKLFRKIEDLDICLKNAATPFVMRGTYHGLANKLDVGWHVEYYSKLKHLLKGDKNE